MRAFAKRYVAHPAPAKRALPTAALDAASVAGAYQISQREDSNVLRLLALLQEPVVAALPDEQLVISGVSTPLEETAPLVFEAPNDLRIAFGRRSRDSAMTMRNNAMPLAMEWERVPSWLDRRVVLPLVGVSVATAVSTIVLWPVAALRRRRRLRPFGATAQDRREHLAVRLVLISNLAATAAVVGGLLWVATDTTRFSAALDPYLVALYAAGWLSVVGAPLACWVAVRYWRDRVGSRWVRIHHTGLAVAAVIFAWFCLTWRLAGTTLTY